jgi:multidrug efflux pump subunit AcrB
VVGYSLDNLSLMGLSIAVGFVVDDAIVMVENIVRHLEMGKTPMQAALDGAGEIGFTIVSISISLVAVFIPLLLMSGMVGKMFQEFAVTVTSTIIVSMFVSVTLTPCSARGCCGRKIKNARGDCRGDSNGASTLCRQSMTAPWSWLCGISSSLSCRCWPQWPQRAGCS